MSAPHPASNSPVGLLMDTHTFLWLALEPSRLPARVLHTLTDPDARRCVSMASFWEMGIKAAIGQLPQAGSLLALEARCAPEGIEVLPVRIEYVDRISRMPFPRVSGREHKDPFDRMIAATALTEGLTLLSADAAFDAYGVHRQW
ncbi:MAG: type II toxin-antitoxin system VapC family toxin [Armatimonadetes bacterium]|nr:type II toxin-antitoxin system VapC family toxin [Armatimonadota bacterium]